MKVTIRQEGTRSTGKLLFADVLDDAADIMWSYLLDTQTGQPIEGTYFFKDTQGETFPVNEESPLRAELRQAIKRAFEDHEGIPPSN